MIQMHSLLPSSINKSISPSNHELETVEFLRFL